MPRCEIHEDLKEQVQDHEVRIRELEQKSVQLFEKLDAVCKELRGVTAWIKTLIMLMLTSMVGFFIWYVQQLGR